MKSLSLPDSKFDLTTPKIMGILNVTHNSFCAKNRTLEPEQALDFALCMEAYGAAMIDVGAEATNPAINEPQSSQQELDRLIPVLELLQKHLRIPFSVDTSDPHVMHAAAKCGMALINDVRALMLPEALETAVNLGLPVCLMHHRFFSPTKTHQDIVYEVKNFLESRKNICIKAGISADKILIDPGFGGGNFGKSPQENLVLLSRLHEFKSLNLPILIGVSRKTFIGEAVAKPTHDRLYGSIAATTIAVLKGANLIRTHDVKETKDAITIATEIMNIEENNE